MQTIYAQHQLKIARPMAELKELDRIQNKGLERMRTYTLKGPQMEFDYDESKASDHAHSADDGCAAASRIDQFDHLSLKEGGER